MSEMRLQRFLARIGVASRRASEDIISQGRIEVNGVVVSRLGTKVDTSTDIICLDGKRLFLPKTDCCIMLNKPTNCLTTMKDPQGRFCVADILPVHDYPGLYPVGRLDKDTSGLLLFTTDGVLGNELLHPSKHVLKRYLVRVSGVPTRNELHQLRCGVVIESGKGHRVKTEPALVELLDAGPNAQISVGIRQGINRQIRKMFRAVGHEVISLQRIEFGPLVLNGLKLGEYRVLDNNEVLQLHEYLNSLASE